MFSEDISTTLAFKFINFRGIHEVYLDDELIQKNGERSEQGDGFKLGRYRFYAVVPPQHLRQGKHILRVKYQKKGETLYPYAHIFLGNYFHLSEGDRKTNNQMILMLMVFLTSAVFFLIFYFGFGRKISFLFLSLYCLAYSIKSILKPYQDFFVPDFLIPFMSFKISHLPANLGSIFLVAFLLWEIKVPKKGIVLLLFAGISVWGYFGLTEVQYLNTLMVVITLIVGFGLYKKVNGIGWMVLGLTGFIVLIALWMNGVLGYGYFAGVIFFLVCMTFSVGHRIAKEIQLKQAAQLRTATLENQLLKKSIQPHFILNSLASLQELIDQHPAKASTFVEQLADEFKLVSKVANQKLISIQDELQMCQTHLKIMEFRKNAQFELLTEGISGEEQVPPGVFHTLLENGITHGYGNKRKGQFLLKKSKTNDLTEYVFFNDGEVSAHQNGAYSKGTGLKYVEARLRETYGENWQLESGVVPNGWQVKLLIRE